MKDNELKARLFALYWGQHVLTSSNWEFMYPLVKVRQEYFDGETNGMFLELKPLSMISYDDCDALGKIYGHNYTIPEIKNWISDDDNFSFGGINSKSVIEMIDYLRSKGYALPYLGISVQEQIDKGWIRLKTNNDESH